MRGIDACAKEIRCRPEVFAQTYRYLKNHIIYPRIHEMELEENGGKRIEQLSLTYHIGEDYLDILDGLRGKIGTCAGARDGCR